jgi:hypothetical protein
LSGHVGRAADACDEPLSGVGGEVVAQISVVVCFDGSFVFRFTFSRVRAFFGFGAGQWMTGRG